MCTLVSSDHAITLLTTLVQIWTTNQQGIRWQATGSCIQNALFFKEFLTYLLHTNNSPSSGANLLEDSWHVHHWILLAMRATWHTLQHWWSKQWSGSGLHLQLQRQLSGARCANHVPENQQYRACMGNRIATAGRESEMELPEREKNVREHNCKDKFKRILAICLAARKHSWDAQIILDLSQ